MTLLLLFSCKASGAGGAEQEEEVDSLGVGALWQHPQAPSPLFPVAFGVDRAVLC